ncbi:hypothetical protein EI94DRAFT_1733220 [Lactarius quietus]|nr:hypothetical protein EI94DRAFT_1733220 [Lactarius quietus]
MTRLNSALRARQRAEHLVDMVMIGEWYHWYGIHEARLEGRVTKARKKPIVSFRDMAKELSGKTQDETESEPESDTDSENDVDEDDDILGPAGQNTDLDLDDDIELGSVRLRELIADDNSERVGTSTDVIRASQAPPACSETSSEMPDMINLDYI